MMPDSTRPTRHVFVYGTLRRGGSNDIARFRPPAQFVAEATIEGTLYDLGPYPGAILEPGALLVGEVYRITAELETQLDALEGIEPDGDGEYRKRELNVSAGAQRLACLVYEIHPARVTGRPVIASGNWFDR